MEVISEYALLHMWGVFSYVFWGGEFEFGVKLMLISKLRSLTSSNDLQSSILLKIGVDLLKISHHAKNPGFRSRIRSGKIGSGDYIFLRLLAGAGSGVGSVKK